MKRLMIPLLAAISLLSACANGADVTRSASPVAIAPQSEKIDANAPKVMIGQYDIKAVNVTVPDSLSVSEANMFYPLADIVWRGEPLGDRHLQVKSIFDEAAAKATATMHQGPAAIVDISVERFHSVTEKTRFTVGGVHDMKYTITVRDAETGLILAGPKSVRADVKASGGAKAVAEDQMGRTQRVVIVERLVASLRAELSAEVTDPLLVSQALGLQPDTVAALR